MHRATAQIITGKTRKKGKKRGKASIIFQVKFWQWPRDPIFHPKRHCHCCAEILFATNLCVGLNVGRKSVITLIRDKSH